MRGIPLVSPAASPGSIDPRELPPRYHGTLEGTKFEPGLYAVSGSLVRGLPWRVYDEELPR